MKKVLSLLTLFSITFFSSAAIVTVFGTAVAPTALAVASFEVAFYTLTALNIIQLPAGSLGVYIGAPGGMTNDGAGVQVISNERSRGAYMSYRTDPQYNGRDITSSYLRLETPIVNGSNRLSFKTYVGDGTTQTATERRLERNDKFAITKMGFFLLSQPNGRSTGRLVSYPNVTEFGATAAADLSAIFNGELSITIQRKKILPFFDMKSFVRVSETQQSSTSNRDKFSLEENMVNLTPHIDLDGSGTNEIEIVFPSHAGFAGATPPVAGFTHFAVFYCKGFLISNGSANI